MFPSRLHELRVEKGLRQTELATLLFVTQATISSWEKGRTSPSFVQLTMLAKAFGVTTDYLLCVDEDYEDSFGISERDLSKLSVVKRGENITIPNNISLHDSQVISRILNNYDKSKE